MGSTKSKMEEIKNKLYVGNLPYSANDESLKAAFAVAGEVTEAKVIMDKFSGRSKGFGFVTTETDEMAQKAIDELNGKELDGRQVFVAIAKPMVKRDNFDRGGSSNRGGYNRSY